MSLFQLYFLKLLFWQVLLSQAEDLHKDPLEAKARLARLFDIVDKTHDNEVDENELTDWIDSIFRLDVFASGNLSHNSLLSSY